MPKTERTPARGPNAMLRARMNIVSGPGVIQSRKLASKNAGRSCVPVIRSPAFTSTASADVSSRAPAGELGLQWARRSQVSRAMSSFQSDPISYSSLPSFPSVRVLFALSGKSLSCSNRRVRRQRRNAYNFIRRFVVAFRVTNSNVLHREPFAERKATIRR
jgi:hypothetical protein